MIDVIQSKNEYALKSSVRQLSGKLSEKIKGLRELVLNNVAYIEAALDDPEHISLDNYVNKLSIDVDKCVDNVDNYFSSSSSPMVTTFPAPIVINRSSCIHFFRTKSSIDLKSGR